MQYMEIPEHTRHSMMLYVTQGISPGRGLRYILENNLFATISHCDDPTIKALRLITIWVHNFAPSESYGSPEKVMLWLNSPTKKCYDTQEGLAKLGFTEQAEAWEQARSG